MRAALLATMIGVVAAGCSLGGAASSTATPTNASGGAPAPLADFRGRGIEFAYPASWSHRHPGILSRYGAAPVIDLSTQPMVDPCTTTGATTRCTLMPIHRLRPGGVVVVWTILSFYPVLRAPHVPKGIHVRIARPGPCRTIGGDASVSASVAVRHHRTYSVGACLRGPGTPAGEQAVRAMLASAVSVD